MNYEFLLPNVNVEMGDRTLVCWHFMIHLHESEFTVLYLEVMTQIAQLTMEFSSSCHLCLV